MTSRRFPSDKEAAAGSPRRELVAGNDLIVRVIDALVMKHGDRPWGVRELADALGASRSTVNRVLLGLADRRLAAADINGTYSIGPRMRVLADRLHKEHLLLRRAPSVVADLAAHTRATTSVVLQGPRPNGAFVALLNEPTGPVSYRLHPGMAMPLHAGSAGRAILSRVGLEVLAGDTLEQYTENTVVDRGLLTDELGLARKDGFVISVGQHLSLAAGVAAPFVTPLGEVGAVSVTQPRFNVSTADLRKLGLVVRRAADELTEQIQRAYREDIDAAPRPRRADGSALGRLERLLELIVLRPANVPAGRELGRVLGSSAATAVRLLDTAREVGLLRSTETERSVAGPLALLWAASLGRITEMADLFDEDLAGLAAATGETCAASVFDAASGVLTLSRVASGTHPLRYGLGAGEPIPLWAGAAGKAVLAHCPREVIHKQKLRPLTARSPRTHEALERDLLDVRRQGWAQADGERIPDAFGLAAPFFADGHVAGSITLTMPRIRREEIEQQRTVLTDAVVRAASRITELLTI